MNLIDSKIPKEAIQAETVLRELLDGLLIGVYLYGSAVMGGLRVKSDVDVLALTNNYLSETTRRELTECLMCISGIPGNAESIRPLEVTVVNHKDVVPWKFPPKFEFMYGEWLRERCEKGDFSGPTYDPDLVLLLAQLERHSIPLFGPEVN